MIFYFKGKKLCQVWTDTPKKKRKKKGLKFEVKHPSRFVDWEWNFQTTLELPKFWNSGSFFLTWKLQETQNTKIKTHKEALSFLQNNVICLSHAKLPGKIIFKKKRLYGQFTIWVLGPWPTETMVPVILDETMAKPMSHGPKTFHKLGLDQRANS